jgi:predicted site-specific integrase-resolvase
MSTGAVRISSVHHQSTRFNSSDQLADLERRVNQLEQRTSRMRIFGLSDHVANRINSIGRFSAASMLSLMIYLLCRRVVFLPKVPA